MKRLAVLLVIGLAFGMALAGTAVKSKYPAYAAIFTNVSQVDFFTGSTAGGSAIGAFSPSLAGYYPATVSGITDCLSALSSSLPSSYTIGGSSGTPPSLTCNFYPNAVTKSGFTVSGWTSLTTKPAASQPDDGELLVITNSPTSFKVSASVSGTVAGGMTLYAVPGYLATDGSFYKPDQNTTVAGKVVSSFSVDQSYAFSTQFSFAKIIPITFYAQNNPLTTSPQSTQQTATITWNGAVP